MWKLGYEVVKFDGKWYVVYCPEKGGTPCAGQ